MEEKKANSLPMNRPTPDLRITHGITTPPPNIGATTKVGHVLELDKHKGHSVSVV